MVARASNCWMYAPPALEFSMFQYDVVILVLILLFHRINIHDQRHRLLNSWTIPINLHDTLSTAMIAVPMLWNGPLEIVTLWYPVLILLVLNHLSILLYIFSFMGILLQLMLTYASPIIAIPSFIIVFFKGIYLVFTWLIWCVAYSSHDLEHDPNPSFCFSL